MLGAEQARAYAGADFEEAHARAAALFRSAFPELRGPAVLLDLGCGAGDISVRLACAFPDCRVHALDGSAAMLRCARERLGGEPADLAGRITLVEGVIPGAALPRSAYDAVFSNATLHHFHDPSQFWAGVARWATPGAPVGVVDVRRANSPADARRIVAEHSGEEPDLLQRDFFHSLCAAFTVEEVHAQLAEAGLAGLTVLPLGEYHLQVLGRR